MISDNRHSNLIKKIGKCFFYVSIWATVSFIASHTKMVLDQISGHTEITVAISNYSHSEAKLGDFSSNIAMPIVAFLFIFVVDFFFSNSEEQIKKLSKDVLIVSVVVVLFLFSILFFPSPCVKITLFLSIWFVLAIIKGIVHYDALYEEKVKVKVELVKIGDNQL